MTTRHQILMSSAGTARAFALNGQLQQQQQQQRLGGASLGFTGASSINGTAN
ncbi:hypothetical protein [Variovorax sp. AFSI2.2]|uniref:hypothetical protein n=1 Tax=Variovorax sp. AFSI2.2 TaxID=3384160 RepID=UPI003EBD48EA